jgi:pimeloyl-ACP methyl ester carboxylesterase
MRSLLILISVLLVFAIPAHAQSSDMQAWLDANNAQPCEDSSFQCVTLPMPFDHDNHDNRDTERTLDVTFAVLPATGESKGLFVTVVGGPGGSGLAVADVYSSYFDPAIFENFDIVFFDQRGIGASNGLDCPQAAVAYTLDPSRSTTPEGEAGVIAAARTFAESCTAEIAAALDMLPEDIGLPYFGTEQAIRDLEMFRQSVGMPQMWLYGESYGTQFAQEYAATYPDALDGLILDGVVDLTLTGEEYYVGQTQAFSDALTATLEACNDTPACRADSGGDALALYDDLAAELATAPITVMLPLPTGGSEARQYTLQMLEVSATNAVYSRDARSFFLRTLAAAARGDLLPLLRLSYQDVGFDPLTQEVLTDTGYFNGAYYAIECNDYRFGSATPDENARAFLAAGDAVEAQVARLDMIYYTDLPCVFWATEGRSERPAAFTGGDYHTFILNSSLDPATPISNGYAVFDRLENASMITDENGPHVIFGRDLACPDVAITAWMIDGTIPTERELVCAGDVLAGYDPLAPREGAALPDAQTFIDTLETEIVYLPEYAFWDGVTTTRVGCQFGGGLTFAATDEGEVYTFSGCAWFDGVAINGRGEFVSDVETRYDLRLSGQVSGRIDYVRDESIGGVAISGSYNGASINNRLQ